MRRRASDHAPGAIGAGKGRTMKQDTLPPLIVDLDGSLVLAETSVASAVASFRKNPLKALGALWAYVDGRAAGKRAFAAIAIADPASYDDQDLDR